MIKNKTNFFRIKNMALIIFLKIKAKIVIKKNYFNNYKRRINYQNSDYNNQRKHYKIIMKYVMIYKKRIKILKN